MSLKKFLAAKATREAPYSATLDGSEFEFHHLRVSALIEARDVVHEVAQAASSLFDPSARNYVKQTVVNDTDPETKEPAQTTVIDAISPVVAKQRLKQQGEGIQRAIDALLSEEQVEKVALLVLDSLREETLGPEEFLNDLSVHELVWFVRQMIEANLAVFAGVRGKVGAILREKMAEAMPEDDSDESPGPESKGESPTG